MLLNIWYIVNGQDLFIIFYTLVGQNVLHYATHIHQWWQSCYAGRRSYHWEQFILNSVKDTLTCGNEELGIEATVVINDMIYMIYF